MRKLTFMMAVVFSLAAANSFAGGKDKGKTKETKCVAGKDCCKKMTKASASEKAKCAKMCAKAEEKKA